MEYIKRKFLKKKIKGRYFTYYEQRKWIPRIWYNYCNGPNFKHRSIVLRIWDGYYGFLLPFKKEQLK